MKTIITFLAVAAAGCANMLEVADGSAQRRIDAAVIEKSVVIDRPAATVFAYVADYANDRSWRTDVKSFTFDRTDGPPLGRVATETLVMDGKDVVTVTEIVTYEEPTKIVSRTPPGAKAYLEATRTCAPLGESKTLFTYRLVGENTTSYPSGVISMIYGGTVEGFLAKLKADLEAAS